MYPSVAKMRCHRGGFHFLKTLDFCHCPGRDGHREAHVLSCWPKTSNPASSGWPRTHLWEPLLPWPARLAQWSRADLNKTSQIEAEAAAEDRVLQMHSYPETLPLLTGRRGHPSVLVTFFFSPSPHGCLSLSLPFSPHLCVLILKQCYVLDPGEATVN